MLLQGQHAVRVLHASKLHLETLQAALKQQLFNQGPAHAKQDPLLTADTASSTVSMLPCPLVLLLYHVLLLMLLLHHIAACAFG